MSSTQSSNGILYTIGHSNHTLEEFIVMLRGHGIQCVTDIRSMPGSRKMPYFNAESLASELPDAGIIYTPCKALGGRRKPMSDSPNTGWRSKSFQAYADYMATPAFRDALEVLLDNAKTTITAIMCAEAVPWRCHRNLVSDSAVLLFGWEVRHIMTAKLCTIHTPMTLARVCGNHLEYPADDLFAPPA